MRAQQQADTDVAVIATRLAMAVEQEETNARQQLLGGDNRTINVRFAFLPAPGHDAAGAGRKGTLDQIVGYYRKLQPQRMVITGEAGSGKTVLAIELILGLLKDRPVNAPVPVRMSAASLDTSRSAHSAVPEWIAGHLTQTYKMSEAAARQLITTRMVLPVLDGLDEMDSAEAPAYASRAGQAIRACNAYIDGQEKAAMVLTCRISQYEALEQAREWVRDAARVQVLPVAVPTARHFLTARATDKGRWQPVLGKMEQPGGSPLTRAMSTPWRLTLAAAVYDQRDPATGRFLRDPADLISAAMDTEEIIRDHLLGLYILAATAAHGSPYPADRVRRWLAVLAGYLHANTPSPAGSFTVIAGRPLSGTDLVMHELWPLAGPRMARIVAASIPTAIAASLIIFLLTSGSIGSGLGGSFLAIAIGILGIITVAFLWMAWPNVEIVDFRRLKTIPRLRGQYGLTVGLTVGIVCGSALGFVFGIIAGPVAGLVAGIAVGLALGLAVVLTVAPEAESGNYSTTNPQQIIGGAFALWLIVGLALGLAVGFAAGLKIGLAAGIVAGLACEVIMVAICGLTPMRYIGFLLCTRRWNDHPLPWRLGRFMHWSYQSGLMRIAGISYQFRHRELQDYLARNPEPPADPL